MGNDASTIDLQATRLYLARWLAGRAAAATGGAIPADASDGDLARLVSRLGAVAAGGKIPGGLQLDPPYPGSIVDDSVAAGTPRVLLACDARRADAAVGVVFTVLIPGRLPEVSVAPPGASANRPHPA